MEQIAGTANGKWKMNRNQRPNIIDQLSNRRAHNHSNVWPNKPYNDHCVCDKAYQSKRKNPKSQSERKIRDGKQQYIPKLWTCHILISPSHHRSIRARSISWLLLLYYFFFPRQWCSRLAEWQQWSDVLRSRCATSTKLMPEEEKTSKRRGEQRFVWFDKHLYWKSELEKGDRCRRQKDKCTERQEKSFQITLSTLDDDYVDKPCGRWLTTAAAAAMTKQCREITLKANEENEEEEEEQRKKKYVDCSMVALHHLDLPST